MASIKFKNVVTFSSQDPLHKVFNLLEQNSQFKRWLCASDDKTGKLQAEFQLEKASKIGFVDIGNYGSAFVEVQVRRSSWPEGKSVTMIPATMMMLPQHCKTGKNKCTVKMFTKEQLTAESVEDSWDRVKVICTQPYKKDTQFGLAFIRLAAAATETDAVSPETPGPTMMKLAAASPSQYTPTVKKPSSRSILAPSWKTNASFHRQVIAATKKEDTSDPGIKSRLLQISATSESKTDKEGALGRSAKLVMAAAAASGKKPNSSTGLKQISHTKTPGKKLNLTQPKTPTSVSSGDRRVPSTRGHNVENTNVDKSFSDLVLDFLSSMSDDKLKHSTLKAIRAEFEQFLGRKLTIPEKADLKAKAIVAVGRLVAVDTSSSSPKPTSNAPTPKSRPPQSHNGSPALSSPSARPPAKDPSSKSTSRVLSSPKPALHTSTPKSRPSQLQKGSPAWMSPSARPSTKYSNSPKSASIESTPKSRTSPAWMSPSARQPTKYPSPKSTSGASTPKSRPIPSPNAYGGTVPKAIADKLNRKRLELNNNDYKINGLPKTPVISQKKASPNSVRPNLQNRAPPVSSLDSSTPKPAFSYGANNSHYASPKSSTPLDQRHLPKSQKKRPASPSWYEKYLDGNQDNENKRAKYLEYSSEDDGWIQVKRPTTVPSTPSTPSTASTSKPTPNGPAWMANVSPSPSTSGTPSRGHGRGKAPGERKACPKCNKSFTAAGIARHMNKCTGPKQKKSSKGRGGRKNSMDNTTAPGGLSTLDNIMATEESQSGFGLTNTDLVTCPMCSQDFPVMLIELHADMCAGAGATENTALSGGFIPTLIG